MLTGMTIATIVVLGICALAVVIGFLAGAVSDGDWALGAMFIVPAIVIGFLAQIGFMMVGYSGDYLAYKPVSGKVEQIASRQVSDGKAMSQRFVFMIDGQQYGVDDTRAALVKEGDAVNLNCTKEFVFGSTNNGYACNWG